MGANNEQALVAIREAEAHRGASLILAYSQCIAHGIDMRHGMKQAARAVASGYWPLFRYDPTMRQRNMNPFRLDSPRPRIPLEEYRNNEVRFKALFRTNPDAAKRMLEQAQSVVHERYRLYEDLASRDGTRFHPLWQDLPS
jgi:pyruvate-ferredoxin/flavodoxin oxidoreductase